MEGLGKERQKREQSRTGCQGAGGCATDMAVVEIQEYRVPRRVQASLGLPY